MINNFFLPSVRHPATGAASGFSVQGEAAGEAIPDVFFLPITLAPARKNLQEIHFKTEGTGAAAYIRTVENPCGDGMEAETWESKTV